MPDSIDSDDELNTAYFYFLIRFGIWFILFINCNQKIKKSKHEK